MPVYIENNPEAFKTQTSRLQKALKGDYTAEQITLLFRKIKRYKIIHLAKTVDHLILTKTFLPPIGDVEAGCRVEAYGDEQREDQEERTFAKDFLHGEKQPRGEMQKEASKLTLDILNHRITKQEFHQKMLQLENKYPGRGWKDQADLLKETEAKNG